MDNSTLDTNYSSDNGSSGAPSDTRPGITSSTTQGRTLGASVGIPTRRINTQYQDETNKYWFANNSVLTLYYVAISSLLPDGEAYFVNAIKNYRDQITNPQLKAEVAGFIGQEMMHRKEHEKLNTFAGEQGLPLESLLKMNKLLLQKMQQWLPKKVQLAQTVASEHFTAVLAEFSLRQTEQEDKWLFTNAEIEKVWHWHALEETEHKSVAFDVYQHISRDSWDKGYSTRIITMMLVTIFFIGTVSICHARLIWSDNKFTKLGDMIRAIPFFWSFKKGLYPSIFKPYLDFYRPGFHPTDHPTESLVKHWRRKLNFSN